MKRNAALVLFSGGQDSTTCLAIASSRHRCVHSLSFKYGQQHDQEVKALTSLIQAVMLRVGRACEWSLDVLDLEGTFRANALIDGCQEAVGGLPATFVPARNLTFLSLGLAHAVRYECSHLYIGTSAVDYSGYPDCRPEFIAAFNTAAMLALPPEQRVEIAAPLLHLSKAQTFDLAFQCGVLDLIVEHTRTCYRNNDTKHEWGYGCGECDACRLRAEGFRAFRASQQTA